MSDVPLYNLAPILELLLLGAVLAGVPLAWFWRRHRHAAPRQRLRALTLLILTLTFELVLLGAFTRLTDSGLGCPDWPGCYGSTSPVGASAHIAAAQAAMPSGPVTFSKAWIEMLHRYMASGVGALIVVLCVATVVVWRRQPQAAVHPVWPAVALVWVCVQGAFGALTVTMRLFPAIVTLHLLMAVGLLALLSLQAVRYQGWQEVALPATVRWGLWFTAALLLLQIALGAWVSTNYAVLACTDFPTCQGRWWPTGPWAGFELWRELGLDRHGQVLTMPDLVTIHHVHRTMAWLVLLALLWAGWRLRRVPSLQRLGEGVLALSVLQLLTGLSNVVLGWPLLAALAHTGGASALMVLLVWALARSRRLAPVSLNTRVPA